MSSDDIAIRVSNVGKRYEIYDTPRDRLKQFVLPRLQRYAGQQPRQYFRDFWALREVSFEVGRGESVGIIGRNGSGKSTLLHLITGTLAPTSGYIHTNGRIAALLELGSGFNPEFTGRENVYLSGALLGMSQQQIEHKFDAIAAFADIGEHLEQPVKTYSSGMLVRLAFAVQVQVEPDILIIDEALAVGDALFQKRCFQQIEKLTANGTTLLFVSHDQESVRTLTSRALLLSHGSTVAWGASPEVVLAYRRLLHNEEFMYLNAVTKDLAARTQAGLAMSDRELPEGKGGDAEGSAGPGMSARLSFGDGECAIERVEMLDSEGKHCSAYRSGEALRIRITCKANADIENLNVAVRLRNKEGVKIYSWGTLNQDMHCRATGAAGPLFWEQHFRGGQEFQVELDCACSLGANVYEVQASVSHEGTPDYRSQRMLHWVDEAAFFQVAVTRDEYFFGGVVDLKMHAAWRLPE